MNRRTFIQNSTLATGALLGGFACKTHSNSPRIKWARNNRSPLFCNTFCDGVPLLRGGDRNVLSAQCRLTGHTGSAATELEDAHPTSTCGPLRVELKHQLRRVDKSRWENLLEAKLTLHNPSSQPCQVEVTLTSRAQPAPNNPTQNLYLPLNVAGMANDRRFTALGGEQFLSDCRVTVGQEDFQCHYLEPLASHPDELTTRAMLLAPVVHLEFKETNWKLAFFTASDQPVRFSTTIVNGQREWQMSRVLTIAPGASVTQRAWLLVHTGTPLESWKAFHEFGHHEAQPTISWPQEFKVHYYDFLSSAKGKDGPRGDGYDADLKHFAEFHVGLATQHGYYPCMGDHIHPDRAEWLAMQNDPHGPAKMSLDKMKRRIAATRATGAKAGVYMHMAALDDSSTRFYPGLENGRRIDPEGKPVPFVWNGPDVKGGLWWMSMSSPEWRAHLLQQAEWIMEVLQPDAICMDETFAGIGYDYAAGKPEPLAPYAIDFFKQLHALVRSHGREKALFSSDCSRSSFCFWADGEVGDHAYERSLGNPLYSQEPVRYLAALGDKPWRPCAWHWQGMWKHQMHLARLAGAGVGVSNGWAEYSGLDRVKAAARLKYLEDIESLF